MIVSEWEGTLQPNTLSGIAKKSSRLTTMVVTGDKVPHINAKRKTMDQVLFIIIQFYVNNKQSNSL